MQKSKKMADALVEHYYLNFELGIEYLAISQQIYKLGLTNLGHYIKSLAEDKLTVHKDKLFNYIVDQDINLNGQINKINYVNYNKPVEAVKRILDQEGMVREKLKQFSVDSLKEEDHETFHFLTWFVNDGTKDFAEVNEIYNLFSLSNDLLAIDHAVKDLMKHKC